MVRQYTTHSYPSLRPIVFLSAAFQQLKQPETIYQPGWWLDEAHWIVLVNGKRVTRFHLSYDNREDQAFFDIFGIRNADKVTIRAAVPKKVPTATTFNDVCAVSVDKRSDGSLKETEVVVNLNALYTASIEPGWAPSQDLIDGRKRGVGQVAVKLDFKSIVPSQDKVRVYAKGDQLLSTDRKDTASALSGILGAERSLTNSWYIPWRTEAHILSNQRGDNASFVVSSGFRTIFPWKWSKALFNNQLLKAPLSPEFEFSVQNESRLRQDAASLAKFKDKNTVRFYSEFAWTPIHLLTGRGFSREDVSVEMAAKGWFLPSQRNSLNVTINRLEGWAEVSLLVPIRKFVPDGGILPDPTAPAARQRIRLKYATGANEANSFRHFHKLSIGYEMIK